MIRVHFRNLVTVNDSYGPPYLIWNRYLMVPPYLVCNRYHMVPHMYVWSPHMYNLMVPLDLYGTGIIWSPDMYGWSPNMYNIFFFRPASSVHCMS